MAAGVTKETVHLGDRLLLLLFKQSTSFQIFTHFDGFIVCFWCQWFSNSRFTVTVSHLLQDALSPLRELDMESSHLDA